ncbi:MAG TPA: bifunctional indole-3-glycerol phosphate synthase/phosphoribosylanthranilate isomerase [Gaiellaceae bacterium]|nr:bifunctional indole-3-glycerol phosphate synthase/phosphoribosylanthranilate isomerase [Gaiellaceae bacterium]
MRLRDALRGPGLAAVAEFKRRSPSMGDIRPDARVEDIVRAYSQNGANAISVLVDERFAGTIDDLRAARAVTGVPLLAKGFFSTEERLRELREAGADAALLILRDLDDDRTAQLMRYAESIGLDTLVEAHDMDELQRAHRLEARIVGVNARDLSTFAIDRNAQLTLVARAKADVVIAESAIHSRAQGAAAELAGADAVLVGTSLMQATDPGAKLRDLVSRPLVKVCGLTRQEDVDAAVDAGADLTGFIFAEGSPRRAPAVLSVPDTVLSVAVFVGKPEERGADLVQLYEHEEGQVRGRDAVLLRDGERVASVADLPWDGCDPEHLQHAAAVSGRLVLAGKLGPDNVRAAIDAVHPWAVDAASRLETAPGIKDHAKVKAFVEEAHA